MSAGPGAWPRTIRWWSGRRGSSSRSKDNRDQCRHRGGCPTWDIRLLNEASPVNGRTGVAHNLIDLIISP